MNIGIHDYMKMLIRPQEWATICKDPKAVVGDSKGIYYEDMEELFSSKDLNTAAYIFAEIISYNVALYIMDSYLNTENSNIAISYLDTIDLDDASYFLLGVYLQEGYSQKCFKDFVYDIVEAYLKNKSKKDVKKVVEDYKTKQCGNLGQMQMPSSMPKVING